jgi:hypothetical protein
VPEHLGRDAANLDALRTGRETRQQVSKQYLHADGHRVHATVWVTAMAPAGDRPGVVLAHIMSHDGGRSTPMQGSGPE